MKPVCLVALLLLASALPALDDSVGWLSRPDRVWVLPDQLGEISGFTFISDTAIACIQDENGIVFIYDLEQERITASCAFGPRGDYEDITLAFGRLYVLRSDGLILEIRDYLSPVSTARTIPTGLRGEIEGLCYDPSRQAFLLAQKEPGRDRKGMSSLYSFDPAVNRLVQLGPQSGLTKKNSSQTKTNSPARPSYSAIAVQSATGTLWVLSAVTRTLALMDRSGRLLRAETLKERDFPQPEGIAFDRAGNLYISNEASGGKATLLRFSTLP